MILHPQCEQTGASLSIATFETIEDMRVAGRNYFKRKIIIVATNFALSHKASLGVGISFSKHRKAI